MYGNGVRIGMEKSITRVVLKIIQKDRRAERTECCAGVRGTIIQASFGLLFATSTVPIIGTSFSDFEL